MAKPIASFNFKSNGLKVTFEDTSVNTPTAWQWDFGNSTNSTLQNPGEVTYATAGVYTVILVANNSDGSATFELEILVTAEANTGLTIRQMVIFDMPPGFALDNLYLSQLIKKWQIYLHPLLNGGLAIATEDVFKEESWNPICNILISKLVLRDLILKAAQYAMISFSTASGAFNQRLSQVNSSTMLVADYAVQIDIAALLAGGKTLKVLLINISGEEFSNSPQLSTTGAILSYLNSLQRGTFIYEGGYIKSLANSNLLTLFNYDIFSGVTSQGGQNLTFTQSNIRVVPINSVSISSSGSSSPGSKGAIKSIESGPSKVEWYDSSEFWTSMFKGYSSSITPSGNPGSGVIQSLQDDCCLLARRVGVRLPFCPQVRTSKVFIVGTKPC